MVYDKAKWGKLKECIISLICKVVEMQVGVSERYYSVNSNGTIFADEPGHPIKINQFGTFIQVNKNFLDDRLRVTGAFRYDKNQNFESQYTPRVSLIYFI